MKQVNNLKYCVFIIQEKITDAKKAKKEENGAAPEDEEEAEDEEIDGEDDEEEYDLPYGEEEDLEGEGMLKTIQSK